MTAPSTNVSPGVERTLDDAVRSLNSIGADLLESYQALEQRAQHVEEELCRTNAELAGKVSELDAVTRDLEAILEALPTGVVVRDDDGRVVRINRAASVVLGAEPEALLGQRLEPIASTDSEWVEQDGTDAAGLRRVIAARRCAVARTAADGRSGDAGSVEILVDRTERSQLAERVHRLDKLAALGNMAGGIAHELRNPMNAVKGFAALLERRLEPGSKEHQWSGRIVEGVTEADSILTSMLTLAAPERLSLESVEAAEVAHDAVAIAETDATPDGEPSKWQVSVEARAPRFGADRLKLRQALRNLVANALDVQPTGGQVRVTATREADDVVFRVEDAGPGVPEEVRGRLLDPFFTTRAEGTGLGLSLVNTIAELHGGRVEISPRPSSLGGADIALRFPLRSPA